MLRRSSEIIGAAVRADDGLAGTINDLLFDDKNWIVRWAVIDTGGWLIGRRVLLPVSEFSQEERTLREFNVSQSRERIQSSPDVATDALLSRQMEHELYKHYDWPAYWPGDHVATVPPGATQVPRVAGEMHSINQSMSDPYLRSTNQVTGHYIHAKDGEIGHAEEFLIEENVWAIRFLVVDTRNWWPGAMVIVSPSWIRRIDWDREELHVDLTRDQVKDSPKYDPSIEVDRAYEDRLFGHYGYTPYF